MPTEPKYFYEMAEIIDVLDPEDKGRVKVKYIRTEIEPDVWVPVDESVMSYADNGFDTVFEVGDKVRLAFIDYPEKQKPFVDGKFQSKNTTNKRNGKETLKIKNHKVVFEGDKVTIEQKDEKGKVVIKSDSIEIMSNGTSVYTAVREETLKKWLTNHIHTGNLGFPVAITTISGYPWTEDIKSKDIKIS